MKYKLIRNGEVITTLTADSPDEALFLLDDERSRPRGTAKALGIAAVRVGQAAPMIKTIIPSRPSGTVPSRHHMGQSEHIPSSHAAIELRFDGDDRAFAVIECHDGNVERSIVRDDHLDAKRFNELVRAIRTASNTVLRMQCHRCGRGVAQ